MKKLREFSDLPQSQQRALDVILRLDKEAFYSSEIQEKIEGRSGGKAAGAILGALYRNGYLEKISGGRDKMWKLAEGAAAAVVQIKQQLKEIKVYWS